jgi:hypothetical protein
VPSQEGVRCDRRFQFIQYFATKRVRFSGEPSTFGVGEADVAAAQAFFEHAILFLEVVNHIQMMAVDPPSEHHALLRNPRHQQVICVIEARTRRIDADLDHDRFPAFHFDGVAKSYFAGSSLILSPPFATGMTQGERRE